jgi:hypothetical protein
VTSQNGSTTSTSSSAGRASAFAYEPRSTIGAAHLSRLPLPRVYLAGKISKDDWRNRLVPGLRDAEFGRPYRCDGFIYGGPFFIACDHGCSHGAGTHGVDPGCESSVAPPRWLVPSLCLDWIGRCDLLFAWIDDPTCYGTLVEIGWAQMMRKPVYIGFARHVASQDMWFAAAGPRTIGSLHSSSADALARALAYGAAIL